MVKPWTRIIGLLLVVAALPLLQACSAVKLVYNNLPDMAYWWLDSYADLDEAQTIEVRAELARLHQWHRSAELTRIADLLQQVRQMAPADTTPEQLCGLFAESRRRFDALAAQVEPGAVALALRLSPEQIAHIERHFAKGNAEWRDEWGSADRAKRMERRLKAGVERAEQFYGTLDDSQRAVLRDAIARSGFDPQRAFAERQRRQQDLLQTLRALAPAHGRARADAAQATAALRGVLERSLRPPDPAYRADADAALQASCRTYALLHNGTSAQQRARAAQRLAAYESDARELAAQR